MPDLFETRRLGELDGLGSDLIDFSEAGRVRLVIQCKGFEKPVFGASQLKQCLTEIKTYAKNGIHADEYWLVLNRSITDRQPRDSVLAALDELTHSGLVKTAHLLDLSHLLIKLESVVRDCIIRWSEHDRPSVSVSNIAQIDYIVDVPFSANDKLLANPSRYFVDAVRAEVSQRARGRFGRDRSPPRLLLKGGFGFGKTATLQATLPNLAADGMRTISVRAADLKEAANYASGHGLLKEILKALTPVEVELSELAQSLAVDVLRRELRSSDRWVLLIDAIDESPFAHHIAKVTALWGGAIDAGMPLLVSVRSELADQRATEFTRNPKTLEPTLFEVLELQPWSSPLIEEFLTRFASAQSGTPSTTFLELQALVRTNAYDILYGDIPKRPLFLTMLADDAWHDRVSPTKLNRLYESYFARKFDRDVTAADFVRPFEYLSIEGFDETLRLLFIAMEEAAALVAAKTEPNSLASDRKEDVDHLTSKEVDVALERAGLSAVRKTELTLHSVLTPAGKSRGTKEQLFRFAHASFQDYFVARWLYRKGESPPSSSNDAVRRFVAEMKSNN